MTRMGIVIVDLFMTVTTRKHPEVHPQEKQKTNSTVHRTDSYSAIIINEGLEYVMRRMNPKSTLSKRFRHKRAHAV